MGILHTNLNSTISNGDVWLWRIKYRNSEEEEEDEDEEVVLFINTPFPYETLAASVMASSAVFRGSETRRGIMSTNSTNPQLNKSIRSVVQLVRQS
jgi:hypothetical protein